MPGADITDGLEGLDPAAQRLLSKQAAGLRAEANAQVAANAEVLPGPLAEAFMPRLAMPGLQVRPLVHFDLVILKRLDSPLLRQLSATKRRKTAFSDEQGYEMVLQFTRPVQEVEALLEKHGTAGFRKLAKREVGMSLGPLEVGLLMRAVEEEFVRAFSTVVKYAGKSDGEGGEMGFTSPRTPAPPTGSAGG
jgi:hypothetical protein